MPRPQEPHAGIRAEAAGAQRVSDLPQGIAAATEGDRCVRRRLPSFAENHQLRFRFTCAPHLHETAGTHSSHLSLNRHDETHWTGLTDWVGYDCISATQITFIPNKKRIVSAMSHVWMYQLPFCQGIDYNFVCTYAVQQIQDNLDSE